MGERGRDRVDAGWEKILIEEVHKYIELSTSHSKTLSLAWLSLLPIQKLNLFVFWKMMRVHLQLCLLILLLVISFVSQAHCDTRNLLDRPARRSSFRKLIRRAIRRGGGGGGRNPRDGDDEPSSDSLPGEPADPPADPDCCDSSGLPGTPGISCLFLVTLPRADKIFISLSLSLCYPSVPP